MESMPARKIIPEEPKKKAKPFKLCFVNQNVPGMSNIHIGRPLMITEIISEKFYTNNAKQEEKNKNTIEKYITELNVLGPREKYTQPVTENQKYGWYQIQSTDVDRSDRRLYFYKRRNILIEEHLMNYAKIRE